MSILTNRSNMELLTASLVPVSVIVKAICALIIALYCAR